MKFDIKPVPPFSFDLSAGIFREGDERIQRYESSTYQKVIRLNGKLVLVSLRSTGTVDKPELSVNLIPDEELFGDDVGMAGEMVRALFNMNLELIPFMKLPRATE